MNFPQFIGGQEVYIDQKIMIEDPATTDVVGTVPKGTVNCVQKAINAANESKIDWRNSSPDSRRRALNEIADRMEDEKNEIATILSQETGKCLSNAKGEVEETVTQFKFYSGITDKIRGDTIPTTSDRRIYTRRVPYGVTTHVIPWNYPLLLGSRSMATALATGNTVVAKAPSKAPLSTMMYARYMIDAFPPGVVNVVTGSGNEIGQELVENEKINAISFTGSFEIGKSVLSLASERIVNVNMELGGKSPGIVLPDADLENAAQGIVNGIFTNAGQNCVALSRVLVHDKIKDKLLDRILELTDDIQLGRGTCADTDMGPVISKSAQHDILEYVKIGQEEGATLQCGGTRADLEELSTGYFVEPTIFDNVSPEMTIAQEEIFGPVLSMITFSSVEEAIEIANGTSYALAASIWTENIQATNIAERLDHGMVMVNTRPVSVPQSPWGGNKKSGNSREGGLEGIESFTTVNSIVIQN